MVEDKVGSGLMALPLEMRWHIFEHTADAMATVKPERVLQSWFEKKDIKQKIEEYARSNPAGPAPQITRQNIFGADGDDSESEDSFGSDVSDSDEDESDSNPDEEEEEDSDDEDDDDDPAAADDDSEGGVEEQDTDDENPVSQSTDSLNSPSWVQPAQSQTLASPSSGNATGAATMGNEDDEQEAQEDADDASEIGSETQDSVHVDHGQELTNEDDADSNAHEDGGADGVSSASQPPPQLGPYIWADDKWRHIPKFMQITRCPPPVEILLTSKQLHTEVKNWYYDVAVLRIEATGSFAHTSFFEEALGQITDAAFSPMENIRKVEVIFVWDSTWIRAEGDPYQAIFPALLSQRSQFVYNVLCKAPDLKEATIHWHDSAQDNESANLMLDTLQVFHTLSARVQIEEHYIAPDAKPHKKSIAGKRRLEFESIRDKGLNLLS